MQRFLAGAAVAPVAETAVVDPLVASLLHIGIWPNELDYIALLIARHQLAKFAGFPARNR
jgi:hypothetical protein